MILLLAPTIPSVLPPSACTLGYDSEVGKREPSKTGNRSAKYSRGAIIVLGSAAMALRTQSRCLIFGAVIYMRTSTKYCHETEETP
mmetsp:Transcript_90242/g.132070  ORF Transcript_90242/g.132070 Transcript_90242/m.132070 type:complete len:86 (+) Transcript_90242:430-687(+)